MGEEAGNGHLVGGTAAVGGDNSRMSLCKGWPLCWESRKAPVAGSHFRGADLSRALAQTNQIPGSAIYSLCDPGQVTLPL